MQYYFVWSASDVDVVDYFHGDVTVENALCCDDLQRYVKSRIRDRKHGLPERVARDDAVLAHLVPTGTEMKLIDLWINGFKD